MIALFCWLARVAAAGEPAEADPVAELIRAESAAPVHVEPFRRADLEQMVEDLVPLVEAATGETFDTVPPVVIADTQVLAGVLYNEQVWLLGHVSDLDREEIRETAADTALGAAHGFVGKYGFLDKQLYVVPNGVLRALVAEHASLDLARPVMELVLAHELTHALQDQHAPLDQIVRGRVDNDGMVAVNCTVEGHAVWVHEQVGLARGNEAAVAVVASILGYDPDHPGISPIPDLYYTSYVYGQGRAFIARQYELGGNARVWDVLRHPPAASAMIVHPDTYSPEIEGMNPLIAVALGRARDRLVPDAWQPVDEEVGDYGLRERLIDTGGDTELADRVVRSWTSRRVGGEMLGAEVQLIAFDAPESARAWVLHMQGASLQQLAEGRATGAVDGAVTPFYQVRSDVAAYEQVEVELSPGESQALSTLWVARGSHVVQVVLVNTDARPARLATVVNRVFRAVDFIALDFTQ